jgi:hypothetical protein
MKQRCLNPKAKDYARYGGRGITVCKRWLVFENFYADMGDCPEGLSLEREKNHQGYSLRNCRWATPAEQQHNTRLNVNLTVKGETMCMAAWARKRGINYKTLKTRVRRGWSVERALEYVS